MSLKVCSDGHSICKLCRERSSSINKRGLCADCDIYSDEHLRKIALLDEIEDNKSDLQHKQEGFLRLFGWHNSCQFPDSCWRWVKVVGGVTIAVSTTDAIHIEQNISHYKE